MKNTNRTGKKVASLAGSTLSNPNASEEDKRLAGSALAQSRTAKSTSKTMETKASHVLRDEASSEKSKTLAGSLVSQSNLDP